MPIDPTGTTPGLTPETEAPKPVHLKCKNCESILAIEIKMPEQAGGLRRYQCIKCKTLRSVAVGGAVDL